MKHKVQLLILIFLFSGLLVSCADLQWMADEVKSFVLPTEIPHSEEEIPFLHETFAQWDSGWDQFENEIGVAHYGTDIYAIEVRQPNQFLWSNPGIESPQNVRIKALIEKISGDNDDFYGVMCRYQNEDNFYAFLISSDGYAGIFKRVNGGELQPVSGATMLPSDAVSKGLGENYIEADCVGSHLALWVNGFEVQVVKEETFTPENSRPGDIGVIAGTFSATSSEIHFKELEVFELK